MLSTFPLAWLLLALPFASAAVIAHASPLRALSAEHHRITWSVGVAGLGVFLAGLVDFLPEAAMAPAVFAGGALSGFACFWPARPDDGEDGRRWSSDPENDHPRPDPPDVAIDWHEFDRLRVRWDRPRRVAP
jgi:hypothetical protein